MAGNVAEWTADWYGATYYSQPGNDQNPQGPISGINRVVRGGSFADRPFFARSVHRVDRAPDLRQPYVGFRCAATESSTSLDGVTPLNDTGSTTTGGPTSPLTVPTFSAVGTVDPASLGAITTTQNANTLPTIPPTQQP
jgi:hypothetical protein